MTKRTIKNINEFWPLLKTQTFYLVDFETDAIIKSTPGPEDNPGIKYYRRIAGEDFELFWENDIVFRAINGQMLVTKKEYENS